MEAQNKIQRINDILHSQTRLWMRKRDIMVLKKLTDPERADEIIKRMGHIEWRMQQLMEVKDKLIKGEN